MQLVPGAELRRITEVRSTDGARAFVGEVAGTIRGEPIVNTVTLQTIALGVILLIGALIVYYFVGVKKRTSEFLIATDGEMKKVNWSTRKEVIGSTWVVVAASFLISAFLFVIDLGFSQFFQFVGVLER
ncbi:MAG: preprotein translocase subunit SecE [Phycisphaerales bacterium]|nr:MAG: preprotein translocase subunit SecE [Phycisphaerales bacterium]